MLEKPPYFVWTFNKRSYFVYVIYSKTTMRNQWNNFIFLYHMIFHTNRLVCEWPSSLKNFLLAVTIIYLHFTQKLILVHDRIPSLFELSTSFCAIVSSPLGISSGLRNNVAFSFFSLLQTKLSVKYSRTKWSCKTHLNVLFCVNHSKSSRMWM